jgi:hypothetical protein
MSWFGDWIRWEVTLTFIFSSAIIGLIFGIVQINYMIDITHYYEYCKYPQILILGSLIRYPIEYTILGALVGVMWPITFILPAIYHICVIGI